MNAFIGNNGTGKSSVIEAMQLLQDLILKKDFNEVFKQWGGLEKIRNKYSDIDSLKSQSDTKEKLKKNKLGIARTHLPISIQLNAKIDKETYEYEIHLNTSVDGSFYQNEYEILKVNKKVIYEDAPSFLIGRKKLDGKSPLTPELIELKYRDDEYSIVLTSFIRSWQFLNLNAHTIGLPLQADKNPSEKFMKTDGSNLAEILKQEFKTREELLNIIEKVKYVLPYLTDIQTSVTTDITDSIFLEMTENGRFKIPGWLLSSGTVRILAMLTALNKKNPSPVLFIEEIENGLDPRTINLLLSEIQANMDITQFIITTHSPYFLDLLDLSHIILVEKDKETGTTFDRPENDETLKGWKDKFSPGQLYLMDRMGKK